MDKNENNFLLFMDNTAEASGQHKEKFSWQYQDLYHKNEGIKIVAFVQKYTLLKLVYYKFLI